MVMKMKKYFFYLVEDDFYDLFKGDNLKAFLEMFFRKEESTYYYKQFDLFVKEIDASKTSDILKSKFESRKDFFVEKNKFSLDNFITSNKEVLTIYHNCVVVETDYEVSPFINTLADNFPDMVGIDVNNYKIDRIGLVSSCKIR
jgi:hypothetical protein